MTTAKPLSLILCVGAIQKPNVQAADFADRIGESAGAQYRFVSLKKEFLNVSFSGVLLKRAENKFLNALFSGVSLMTWPQQLSLTGMGITSTSRRTGTYTRKLLITARE